MSRSWRQWQKMRRRLPTPRSRLSPPSPLNPRALFDHPFSAAADAFAPKTLRTASPARPPRILPTMTEEQASQTRAPDHCCTPGHGPTWPESPAFGCDLAGTLAAVLRPALPRPTVTGRPLHRPPRRALIKCLYSVFYNIVTYIVYFQHKCDTDGNKRAATAGYSVCRARIRGQHPRAAPADRCRGLPRSDRGQAVTGAATGTLAPSSRALFQTDHAGPIHDCSGGFRLARSPVASYPLECAAFHGTHA